MAATSSSTQKASTPLETCLSRKALHRLAGSVYFELGQAYCNDGHVQHLAETGSCITADVFGTRNYRVKLWMEGDVLDYDCSCPLGEDGEFCKHCVAVGLAWGTQTSHLQSAKAPAKYAHKPVQQQVNSVSRVDITRDTDLHVILQALGTQDLLQVIQALAQDVDTGISTRLAIADRLAARGLTEAAIALYQAQVERLLIKPHVQNYRKVMGILEKIAQLPQYPNKLPFLAYIKALRIKHTQKSVFIRMLKTAYR